MGDDTGQMNKLRAEELVRRIMFLTAHVTNGQWEGDDHLIAPEQELVDEAVKILEEYVPVVQ